MAQRLAGEPSNELFDEMRAGKEVTTSTFGTKTGLDVSLLQNNNDVSVQNPLPTDGDSVYCKDIDLDNSDIGDFVAVAETGAEGTICDLFNNIYSILTNTTSDNPKILKIMFKRTIYSHAIGLGCNNIAGGFGSDITIKLLGSSGAVRFTKNYSGLDSNSALLEFGPKAFNGIQIEFNNPSQTCISNITIRKAIEGDMTIQGVQDNGNVDYVGLTNKGHFKIAIQEYGDTPAIDPFGNLRVSEQFTLFDSKQLHDKQPLFWDEDIGGSATSTHNSINACTEMRVTANTNDYVIRQTKQRPNYQPGKGQKMFMTFRSPMNDGITNRIGIFDGTGTNNLTPNNGIFLETDGSLSWNICKNGTISETITQTNWNVDTLDGNGDSGIVLDMTSPQILIIDFEWLGVGRVRVGFVIDGLIYYCHYFNHSNNSDFLSVYMSTPNLPLRYSIETDGTSVGALDHICSTVISEGGQEQTGILRGIDNGTTALTASSTGTTYAVVGIKLKDVYKDITIIPEFFSLICTTNDNFRWDIRLNPTVAGTFTYNDIANSALQEAIGVGTNTVTGGVVIDTGYGKSDFASNRKLVTALRLGSTIAGVQDEIVLCVTPLSNNANFFGSLTVRELL